MKSLLIFLNVIFISLLLNSSLFSQTPEGINYQAVMRNGLSLATNHNITIKFDINLMNSSGGVGTVVYSESHNVITNGLGVVNLVIGMGVPSPTNTISFSHIDWGNNQFYLTTSVDFTGANNNFQEFGEQRLMSVPYALYSKTSESVINDQVNDADSDPTNELELPNSANHGDVLVFDSISNSWINGVLSSSGPTGPPGPSGQSAYDLWIANGNTGSQQDFLNSLQGLSGNNGSNGTNGINGSNGTNGQSAYDIWIANGNTGTQQDFLNSLQGPSGNNGTNGSNGTNGTNGQSAYDIWIANGNTGTQQDFLNSLQGAQGATGPAGPSSTQTLSISGSTISLSNGGGAVSINDADSDPSNEIELPSSASTGDLLQYNGSSWVAISSGSSSSSAGTVMYIYNNQTCPTGWTHQNIGVAIFGGAPVDACWTDTPCSVMYIYNNQTCPTGWTHQNIGVAIINGTNTSVDACFKCY